MSEENKKFVCVTHITVKCVTEVEVTSEGLHVQLNHDPKYAADSTVVAGKGLEESALQDIHKILTYTILQKVAAQVQLPDGTAEPVATDEVTTIKGELN